jgi:hypothetical protein
MACGGESIPVPRFPDGKRPTHLYLLAGADEDSSAIFRWKGETLSDNAELALEIPAAGGWLGLYDQRQWKRANKWRRNYIWRIKCIGIAPGFIKRQRLEFYTTHTHKNGRDLPYRYGYMFRFCLPIPERAESLQLPEDKRIKIFAATAASTPFVARAVRRLADKYDY